MNPLAKFSEVELIKELKRRYEDCAIICINPRQATDRPIVESGGSPHPVISEMVILQNHLSSLVLARRRDTGKGDQSTTIQNPHQN